MNSQTQHNEWAEDFCSLNRYLRELKRDLRAAAASERLNHNEAIVLLCCYGLSRAGIPQKQMVEYIGVSAAQISSTVDSLQSRGLLTSHRPINDRRNQVWRLLEPGEQVARRLVERLQKNQSLTAPPKRSDANVHPPKEAA